MLYSSQFIISEEHLFNLKFAAKELNRNAKKCDKEEKAEKAKIKKVSNFFVCVWYADLSLLWPLPLQSTGSRHAGSVAMAPGPSCSTVCGIFPDRGTNPCPLHQQADSQPLRHQGSPKAIQKGNTEVVRHAENAIRQKNQTINFLRMSARVDAVAARVQSAVTMGKVTKSMANVVKSMDATLRSMNLEKISALMDKFEQQFETLDVQTQQMEDTMSSTTTLTTPQNQVDMLLQEMADEAGLDLSMELPQGQTGCFGTGVTSMEQDEVSQRLARLRDQV
ncbi:charged multivesicular body protein 1B2-like isoform X1 [Pseudorca crassidens]|uniref:charged multivesicular body protein 1B2-like isoform X1 n=1 Tax=Pseudorca crassidens TaxID=82174 RepID=UPI00352E22F1